VLQAAECFHGMAGQAHCVHDQCPFAAAHSYLVKPHPIESQNG
jgi:hypothetical protein